MSSPAPEPGDEGEEPSPPGYQWRFLVDENLPGQLAERLRAEGYAAERTIWDHQIITLSARDSRAVMQALLNPEPAGLWLRQAARRYKDVMGRR